MSDGVVTMCDGLIECAQSESELAASGDTETAVAEWTRRVLFKWPPGIDIDAGGFIGAVAELESFTHEGGCIVLSRTPALATDEVACLPPTPKRRRRIPSGIDSAATNTPEKTEQQKTEQKKERDLRVGQRQAKKEWAPGGSEHVKLVATNPLGEPDHGKGSRPSVSTSLSERNVLPLPAQEPLIIQGEADGEGEAGDEDEDEDEDEGEGEDEGEAGGEDEDEGGAGGEDEDEDEDEDEGECEAECEAEDEWSALADVLPEVDAADATVDDSLPENVTRLLEAIANPASEFGLLETAESTLATPAMRALKAMCAAKGANVPAAATAHKRGQPLPEGCFIVKVHSRTRSNTLFHLPTPTPTSHDAVPRSLIISPNLNYEAGQPHSFSEPELRGWPASQFLTTFPPRTGRHPTSSAPVWPVKWR